MDLAPLLSNTFQGEDGAAWLQGSAVRGQDFVEGIVRWKMDWMCVSRVV